LREHLSDAGSAAESVVTRDYINGKDPKAASSAKQDAADFGRDERSEDSAAEPASER